MSDAQNEDAQMRYNQGHPLSTLHCCAWIETVENGV